MSRRPVRQRRPKGRSRVGEEYDADIGPVAHGGHCVARVPDGERARVVFVRHAIPGERVRLRITEGSDGDSFWRGDAITVLAPSTDRVVAPCPVAGPGLCGGCDFQHVALPAQRGLKADVVREQLVRLGHLSVEDPLVSGLVVEPVPGDDEGLRWRTRMAYHRLPDGRRGLLAHRSHEVIPVGDCLIAAPDARGPGPGTLVETVTVGDATHAFRVAADGFWQVHPGAPTALVSAVLEVLAPRAGESVLDLYAGVGLFAAFLADVVGADRVTAVEADATACAHARENLPDAATVRAGATDEVLAADADGAVDLVVLDPPREGARRRVVEQVVARLPRAVAYVACDPAALSRDVAIFAEHGYRLTALRAFDLFPMTSHTECVALLEPVNVCVKLPKPSCR